MMTTLTEPTSGRARVVGYDVMFTAMFPVTFLANTFVPTEPMPHCAGDRGMEPGVVAGASDA